jgi:hypothetical protein
VAEQQSVLVDVGGPDKSTYQKTCKYFTGLEAFFGNRYERAKCKHKFVIQKSDQINGSVLRLL